jgi:cytochrome c556
MHKRILSAGVLSALTIVSTFANDVSEIVSARQGLMQQTAFLSALARTTADLGDDGKMIELYEIAIATAQSLEAFGLMFPENTNLLGSAAPVEGVTTTAAAAIWDDLEGFRALVNQSAELARSAAESTEVTTFTQAWEKVEATCSSCHEAFVFYDPFASF